jgi:4-amino-4-deoxy-L-arabinose transferase-like glycosyltransferase
VRSPENLFSPDRPVTRPASLLVLAVVALAFFAQLGSLDFVDPDESRHAEIAREMIVTGEYLTPKIHGVPYYDKPVLFHWAVAASMKTFGLTPSAVRLPSALAALATVASIAAFIGRCYGGTAALATAVGMATTLSFVGIGRFAVVDGLLTAILTLAFVRLGHWYLADDRSRVSLVPIWLLLGLGLLAKGPVAIVLVVLAAIVLAILDRDIHLMGSMKLGRGLALAVAIAMPWYLAAWAADPEYIETFLWHHNVERYLGTSAFRHQGPWYYYLVAVPLGLLPWTPFVLAAVVAIARRGPRRTADRFLLVWASVVLLFYQGGQTRLLTYVLPAFPPLIAMGAVWWAEARAEQRPLPPALERYCLGWCLFVAAVLCALPPSLQHWLDIPSGQLWIAVPAGLGLAIAALYATARARPDRGPIIVAAACLVLTLVVYGPGARAFRFQQSAAPAARLLLELQGPEGTLVAYKTAPHAVSFYAGRIATRLNDPEAAVEAFAAGEGRALYTKLSYLDELGLEPLPGGIASVWTGAHGRVLLVNESFAPPGRVADADHDVNRN